MVQTPEPSPSGVPLEDLLQYKLGLGFSVELGIHNPPVMGPEPLVVLQEF